MAVGLAVLVGAVFFRQPPGDEGVRQDVAGLFFVALLLTLMPYTYMSMFVADRVFFQEDPLQPLYSTPAYYASVSGINALVSTLNGILLMLIVYGFLGECFSILGAV
ncbi:g9536 [Coccomyxa viridis]|uniref:G9536 protein n=1 Tax=Coccomyxa viridis TaxID=1274662 RepID=A0ABP1G2Y6_9CHLO